ncbi:hypothetical protein SRABI106_03927 [Rahnella aquatilis]|nr:hypothetical protein SRABI106_03927 [Rahnella aquatilis]
MQQIFIFRLDRGIKQDAFISQRAVNHRADVDTVKLDRLPRINSIALRRNQLNLDGTGVLKQALVTVKHHEMLLRFPIARDQFQRITRQ